MRIRSFLWLDVAGAALRVELLGAGGCDAISDRHCPLRLDLARQLFEQLALGRQLLLQDLQLGGQVILRRRLGSVRHRYQQHGR
ncbi:hypothetical protein [Massilia sp. TWR1-2-2]|uniref:hypothetical protein n=1 Tax=Massilia sp. TWR1-2-2 TaxID=2804584 RepID=UPI003CE8D947